MKYSKFKSGALRINKTGEMVTDSDPRYKDLLKKYKTALSRKEKNELYEACGLIRGKDSLGRTIWE